MRKLFSVGSLLAIAWCVVTAVPSAAHAAGTGCLPGVLKQRLSQIRQNFGPVKVVSAHRPGARIAGSGKRSLHSSCRAVDFIAPAGKYRAVVSWLKQKHAGGVGTYSCGMNHIHIDNGPRVRYHHCVTASGRPVSRGSRTASRARNRNTRVARQARTLRGVSALQSRATKPPAVSPRPAQGFSALGHFTRNKLGGR